MKDNTSINVNLVLERIKKLRGITRDLQLCEELGVKQTTFSSWRSRDTLDFKLILEFVHAQGMDLNYILFGKGVDKASTMDDFLTLISELVANKLKPQFEVHSTLHEKLLFLLEKEDIRRQLEAAREGTEKKIKKH